VLAVQVHGGYGYSSEYLPEAWLRDQKLNSLHEGTTGIQSLDLLGRKIGTNGGAALELLEKEIRGTVDDARSADLPSELPLGIERAVSTVRDLTAHLVGIDDPEKRLSHSADYLELFSTLTVGWMWLRQAAVAKRALSAGAGDAGFYEGKLSAATYFIRTEVPKIDALAALCRSGDDSYALVHPDWL
jgi:hypothetical protein